MRRCRDDRPRCRRGDRRPRARGGRPRGRGRAAAGVAAGGSGVLRRARLPTADDVAAYYRERKLAAVIFTVDAETVTGRPAVPNEEIAEVAAANPDVPDPVRLDRSEQGRAGGRGGEAADPRLRREGLQVPPERPGLLPERPLGLSAVRGRRRGGPARALPHGTLRDRRRPSGRWGYPAQVLEPDVRRRRRRRLPGAEDRARAPVLSLAGRGDLGRAAQAAGLHRPLRLVAEVLPAPARPVREHASARPRSLRLRLPADHAGPLARGLRARRLQRTT